MENIYIFFLIVLTFYLSLRYSSFARFSPIYQMFKV